MLNLYYIYPYVLRLNTGTQTQPVTRSYLLLYCTNTVHENLIHVVPSSFTIKSRKFVSLTCSAHLPLQLYTQDRLDRDFKTYSENYKTQRGRCMVYDVLGVTEVPSGRYTGTTKCLLVFNRFGRHRGHCIPPCEIPETGGAKSQ